MQSNGTHSLIMPCFASEVRTPTDGHGWCHSPYVFFFLCGRLRDCVGCYATAFVLVPRFWSLVLSAARIRKHVVGMHIMFDKQRFFLELPKVFCAVCLVERLYVKGGSKGCFAAVFSVREVPALDVSVREPHLCSCASVTFFCELCNICFCVLRCSLSSVTRFRTTIRVGFFIAAHIVQLFLSRSHVFTKAVHLNAIHRFAGTVRGRGRGHMVDRVASNDPSCFTQ